MTNLHRNGYSNDILNNLTLPGRACFDILRLTSPIQSLHSYRYLCDEARRR